jgi:hypothetical protein
MPSMMTWGSMCRKPKGVGVTEPSGLASIWGARPSKEPLLGRSLRRRPQNCCRGLAIDPGLGDSEITDHLQQIGSK